MPISQFRLIGGELPADLLPPVPAFLEAPQVAEPPVVDTEQVEQQTQLRVIPRLQAFFTSEMVRRRQPHSRVGGGWDFAATSAPVTPPL